MKSRYSLRQARALLIDACHKTPSLPGSRGSRLMANPSCNLRDGKRTKSYTVNVFDRAPAWVKPRFQVSFVGTLDDVTDKAIAWIESHTPALQEMAEQVARVTVNPYPFTAEIPTLRNGCAA